MNDPCEIWFRFFVVAFIVISAGTIFAFILTWSMSYFTKGGNILYHSQEREIKRLKDELEKSQNNSDNT